MQAMQQQDFLENLIVSDLKHKDKEELIRIWLIELQQRQLKGQKIAQR